MLTRCFGVDVAGPDIADEARCQRCLRRADRPDKAFNGTEDRYSQIVCRLLVVVSRLNHAFFLSQHNCVAARRKRNSGLIVTGSLKYTATS